MSTPQPAQQRHYHPPGFRARRGLNWGALGLMYASYYMCRYNFRFATPGMQEEFGFTLTQISDLLAIWSLTYGTGQLVNGLLTDRIGGKRSMQIGAFGTIVVNLLMGLLPLLAIGVGMQLLNVSQGGNLFLHIPEDMPKALPHKDPLDPAHRHGLEVVPGTIMERVYGDGEIRVNSMHHMACDAIAPGFMVSARSSMISRQTRPRKR